MLDATNFRGRHVLIYIGIMEVHACGCPGFGGVDPHEISGGLGLARGLCELGIALREGIVVCDK